MKPFIKYIQLIMIIFAGQLCFAQNKCDWAIINDASDKFRNGNFEELIEQLQGCINQGFDDKQKVQAYRLLAKAYLELDNDSLSVQQITQLLNLDAQFQPDFLSDSPRFIEILQQIKDKNNAQLVTSVSKKSENVLEAPATVVVITEKDIKERGYSDIEEIFYDLPGFDVIRGRGPAYSLMYERGYRSISNDRTILLIDGVEENDLASDNMTISRQYPLSDIKRIEFVYGPASTMYGANAFVGVINVVTKTNDELFSGSNKLAVDATINYASMNTKAVDATVAGRTKNVSFSCTGRYFASSGMDISGYDEWKFNLSETDYASIMDISGENTTGGYLAQDYINKTKLDALNANGLYTITRNGSNVATNINLTQAGINQARMNDSLVLYTQPGLFPSVAKNDKNWFLKARMQTGKFSLGIQSWKTDEGLAPWYTNKAYLFREDRSRWITWNSMLYANYENAISDKVYFTNLLSYRIHEINGGTDFEQYTGYLNDKLSFANLSIDSLPSIKTTYYYRTSNQVRNETRFTYTPNKKFNLLAGLELRSSMIQGNYITNTKEIPDETGSVATQSYSGTTHFRTFDVGTFSQLSYKIIPVLTFTLGGRGDYNKIRTTGGYGLVFNPRVVLVFTPKNFIFKAIYSEAFKDASYLQRYSTSASRQKTSPGLQPEKVKNIEISAYWKINDNINFNLAGYRAYYRNAVKSVTVPYGNGTTEQFQAVGAQKIMGVQSELNVKIGIYRFYANYTYTLPTDKNTNLSISDIATHKANLIANALFYKYFNLNLRANYVGLRKSGANTSGSNNPITEFDPYVVLNSTLTVSDYIKNLSISLSVNNLLNKEYFEPGVRDADGITYASRFPQYRINFNISVTYKL
jgi:outer membrane receptor for ferrienterochelin and colicins